MMLVLILSAPPIIMAVVIGLGVSLMQALTQIQEQTLGVALKLVVVTAALFFGANWMGEQLIGFTNYIFDRFVELTV
jgi:type III secretion protein S